MTLTMDANALAVVPGILEQRMKVSVVACASEARNDCGVRHARQDLSQSSAWGTPPRKSLPSDAATDDSRTLTTSGQKNNLTAFRCCLVSECCRTPRDAICAALLISKRAHAVSAALGPLQLPLGNGRPSRRAASALSFQYCRACAQKTQPTPQAPDNRTGRWASHGVRHTRSPSAWRTCEP